MSLIEELSRQGIALDRSERAGSATLPKRAGRGSPAAAIQPRRGKTVDDQAGLRVRPHRGKRGGDLHCAEVHEDRPSRRSRCRRPLCRAFDTTPGRGEHKLEGEVVDILQRDLTTLTGRFEVGKRFSFVVPDNERIGRDIYISAGEEMQARGGDKVVVRLHPWTDENLNPEGSVIEVLGRPGTPGWK